MHFDPVTVALLSLCPDFFSLVGIRVTAPVSPGIILVNFFVTTECNATAVSTEVNGVTSAPQFRFSEDSLVVTLRMLT